MSLRRSSFIPFLGAFLGFGTFGCARQPIVRADALPVKHVVIYRNGVAYFERSGHVDEGEVRFKMKQTEVGDFLATLAVMEKGGSSVRAAAFPLDLGDDDKGKEGDDDGPVKVPKKERTEDEKKGLRTVVLSLDGKAHDLAVGYVAESPVWKPSYRLVVHPNGVADLQAWGVVENLSGEDWKNVGLTLVAGAPVAYQSQLGDPVIPQRPIVTDQGEVIQAVPRGDTTLRQEDQKKAVPSADKNAEREEVPGAPAAAAAAVPMPITSRTAGKDASKKAPRHASPAGGGMGGASQDAPGAPPPAEQTTTPSDRIAPSGPRNLQSLAAIAAEGSTTRYQLPVLVNVPDKSATMVLLLSKTVPGEALYEYSPSAGVPDSSSHPFRVGRFSNKSGGLLERGPIAVFEDGSFLGQGLIDPLPDGAVATVPFALERSLAVEQEKKWDEKGARLVKIENGELTVERDSITETKYRIRNGGELPAKMLVRHGRQAGTELLTPPSGTEDNVGTGSALVPTNVAPHATADLVVDERATIRRGTDWFSVLADNAFKAYGSDPQMNREILAKLTTAWVVRDDIVKKQQERTKLAQEQTGLSQSTDETRKNLRAIERNKVADALRAKLLQRLTTTSNRLDEVQKQIVDLDSKLAELVVRFKEGVRDIKLWIPPTST
jgi:Domain of unknown function (DUF4139)